MASVKTTEKVTEKASEQMVAATKEAVAESIYTAEELANSSTKVFGAKVRRDCVVASFRCAGVTSATVAEAKKIVNAFLQREVK